MGFPCDYYFKGRKLTYDQFRKELKGLPMSEIEGMFPTIKDEGIKSIAWTTGEQQNERYSLEKDVDFVKKRVVNGETFIDIKPKEKGGIVFKVDSNGTILDNTEETITGAVGKNISDVIGKDVSERILASDKDTVIEGEGLKVGGKGMIDSYGSPNERSKKDNLTVKKEGELFSVKDEKGKTIRTFKQENEAKINLKKIMV
ncbi:MAG: hypothetical protein IPQ27_13160 [Chitinophagaceae bacterium]|nr:hypothetical protein [Chitinophagaceae bacterium]